MAIYSDLDTIIDLKRKIQEILVQSKTFAKITLIYDSCKLLRIPGSYDIYIMDMDFDPDETIELSYQMSEIDPDSKMILMCSRKELAYKAASIHAHYFLPKPINKKELETVLMKIKSKIQKTNIIVRTTEGDKRVKVCNINYINIVKRNLCYHLVDGNVYDGLSLRTSFKKTISPLDTYRPFIFISPSLLINVNQIKILNKDYLIFENDEILYFPRKHYNEIYHRWKIESRIIE